MHLFSLHQVRGFCLYVYARGFDNGVEGMSAYRRFRLDRSGTSPSLPEEVEPLDEMEQESIVTSLESQQVISVSLNANCQGLHPNSESD